MSSAWWWFSQPESRRSGRGTRENGNVASALISSWQLSRTNHKLLWLAKAQHSSGIKQQLRPSTHHHHHHHGLPLGRLLPRLHQRRLRWDTESHWHVVCHQSSDDLLVLLVYCVKVTTESGWTSDEQFVCLDLGSVSKSKLVCFTQWHRQFVVEVVLRWSSVWGRPDKRIC